MFFHRQFQHTTTPFRHVNCLWLVLAFAWTALAAAAARADVVLPAIFGDHMVLQADRDVPVWGTAEPGEAVTVRVQGQQKRTTAGPDGRWRVTLDPLEAGGEPTEVVVRGNNAITFRDVLVGEVWLCSGQSNMGYPLKHAAGGAKAVKAADRPRLRLFTVGRVHPDTPQTTLTGQWKVCSPETVGGFSAVAYFFGVEVQDALDRPVGLIQASWGGTRAEAWLPREAFDALKLPYEPAWTNEWLHPKPKRGSQAPAVARPHEAPAGLFNGMIAPLAGYALRGFVWYQGETNTAYGEHYRDVLAALVASWRAAWGQGDAPFLVVQLPNFRNSRSWPLLRAGQAAVAKELPNVGLAVTIDVGNPKNIHPAEKRTVGKRLALIARKLAYGEDVPYSGPTYRALHVEGAEARIEFDHVHDGLKKKGGDLAGFELAGADGTFHAAAARIDGDQVVLTAPGVPAPRAVRYAWSNDPEANLYNSADLPAAPFEAKR